MMFDWTDFDNVFRTKNDYALDQKQIDAILKQRKDFGGTLYFDRIWTGIGLKQAQKVYPPRSNADLRSLWQKVVKSDVSEEMKQAMLFYILRDCKQPSNIDSTFARKSCLPLKYQVLVTGLWELDHAQFPRALEHLTDPCLSPEFADDILLTLIQSPRCDNSLAMAYYLTVSPPLRKLDTLEAYFHLLLQTSIVEAYHFTQKQDPPTHDILFQAMLKIVLEEDPSPAKAERMILLLGLPLTEKENQMFEHYLLKGDGAKIPGAKDTVIMRRIALGQSFEGIGALDRYRGTKVDGVNWDDIRLLYQSANSGSSTA